MESTIRDQVWLCSELFRKAPDTSNELRDVHQRFVEWYTNIAGHRVGPASLDQRLRDAPDVRATILRFLDTLQKALEYHGQEGPAANKSSDKNQVLESLIHQAASSKSSSLMHKVVDSLKRISITIRTPASIDRYAKSSHINLDYYRLVDKSHVEQLYPEADPILQNRLTEAILSRRRFLKYTEAHKEKLARDLPFQQERPEDHNVSAEGGSEFADTEATPFSPEVPLGGIYPTELSDNASDGASSSLRSDMSARVPPMPSQGQNRQPFECPCCYLMMQFKSREDWKKHVFADMKAYVCTFTDCEEPKRLFVSRHDWYSHEIAFHRRIWVCISSCSLQFNSKADFNTHMRTHHIDLSDSNEAENHGSHSRRRPEPPSSVCPICRDEINHPEQIKTHIGRHQARLGLWPLRQMRYFEDDGQEENEGNEREEKDDDGDDDDDDDDDEHVGDDDAGEGSAEEVGQLPIEEGEEEGEKQDEVPGIPGPQSYTSQYARSYSSSEKPYDEDFSNYVLEKSEKFQFGIVFKIMWSEPMGHSRLSRHNEDPIGTNIFISEFGHRISSNDTLLYEGIRRFIVMDGLKNNAGTNHSVCVPIATYGRNGCKEPKIEAADHGIIYTSSQAPMPLDGEPELGVGPVRLVLKRGLDGIENLAPQSRINYSKHVSIDRNSLSLEKANGRAQRTFTAAAKPEMKANVAAGGTGQRHNQAGKNGQCHDEKTWVE